MRHAAAAALVVLVLGGCGGGGGDSDPPADPGPFTPLGAASPTGRFLPAHLAVAWFDGDAYPDVAMTDGVHPEIRVLLGAADGTFMPIAPHGFGVPVDPIAIVAGFFSFDAFADLVVIGRGGAHNVLLGNGDGTFTPLYGGLGGIVPGVPASALVGGNFNGDFFDDVAFGTPDGRAGAAGGTTSGGLASIGGVFNLQTTSPVRSVAAGDVDDDGDLDIVTLQEDTTLSVLGGIPGGFVPLGTPMMIGGTPRAIVAGRFDLSNGDDIAVIDGVDAQVRFFSGSVSPFSSAFQTVALGETGAAMTLEPRPLSSRDGIVATTIEASGTGMLIRISFDEILGAFVAAPIAGAPAFPVSLAFADMNLDSAPDLLVGSFDLDPPLLQGFIQTFAGSGL